MSRVTNDEKYPAVLKTAYKEFFLYDSIEDVPVFDDPQQNVLTLKFLLEESDLEDRIKEQIATYLAEIYQRNNLAIAKDKYLADYFSQMQKYYHLLNDPSATDLEVIPKQPQKIPSYTSYFYETIFWLQSSRMLVFRTIDFLQAIDKSLLEIITLVVLDYVAVFAAAFYALRFVFDMCICLENLYKGQPFLQSLGKDNREFRMKNDFVWSFLTVATLIITPYCSPIIPLVITAFGFFFDIKNGCDPYQKKIIQYRKIIDQTNKQIDIILQNYHLQQQIKKDSHDISVDALAELYQSVKLPEQKTAIINIQHLMQRRKQCEDHLELIAADKIYQRNSFAIMAIGKTMPIMTAFFVSVHMTHLAGIALVTSILTPLGPGLVLAGFLLGMTALIYYQQQAKNFLVNKDEKYRTGEESRLLPSSVTLFSASAVNSHSSSRRDSIHSISELSTGSHL